MGNNLDELNGVSIFNRKFSESITFSMGTNLQVAKIYKYL